MRRRNWARLIAKVYLEDPQLCRTCGKLMPIVAAITSPGQDDVIEKMLAAAPALGSTLAAPTRRESTSTTPAIRVQ